LARAGGPRRMAGWTPSRPRATVYRVGVMSSVSPAAPARARAGSLAARSGTVGLRELSPHAKAALALLGAALCALALVGVWVLAAFVPATHWRDALLFARFTELERPGLDNAANGLLDLLSPAAYTAWALLIVAVALVRRRPFTALVLALVLPAAPLSTELLKPLLAHPHAIIGWRWVGPASFPSGHSTAIATLVLCALIAAPARLRPALAALGALAVAAVCASLLILAWHMPSDVLGGLLLAAFFACLAAAAMTLGPPRRRAG
jgi:membrane-associated phospholipid phosphatase